MKYKRWIQYIAEKEKKRIKDINIIFCSDRYLQEINTQYLKKEELTDVIAFHLNSDKENLSGEIYISIERVEENSTEYCTSFDQELKRVIVHGVLHLLGFKDDTRSGKHKMKLREDKYIADYTIINKSK
jgi:rRNA maturation RNase YbeY